MKRALISVADKTGVGEFAAALAHLGYEIVASGGTALYLKEQGVAVTEVSQVTNYPEMMDGRVKTLHPAIHGGILMRTDNPSDVASARQAGIQPISIVVVNLYPFERTVTGEHSLSEAIENIDIGGPALVRAAAKNYAFVAAVTDPSQYHGLLCDLREYGEIALSTRQKLARAAFQHTAYYDSMVAHYLARTFGPAEFPSRVGLPLSLVKGLRYGENPHQEGALYAAPGARVGLPSAVQLQGKELSYCNILDADAAWALVSEFSRPAAVVVKHATPCGVATAPSLLLAYQRAADCDPISTFGGIVALNREVDVATASAMREIFLEVIVAPKFSDAAREILSAKRNLRLLTISDEGARGDAGHWEVKSIQGGYLVQTSDTWGDKSLWQVVTSVEPTSEERQDLEFAFVVAKHVKSNAIVIAKQGATQGIGTGQTNRIDAARQALERAGERAEGAVLASEAFFPQPDVLLACVQAGIVAVIHPGGSINDDLSLAAANAAGIAMLYSKERHFKH